MYYVYRAKPSLFWTIVDLCENANSTFVWADISYLAMWWYDSKTYGGATPLDGSLLQACRNSGLDIKPTAGTVVRWQDVLRALALSGRLDLVQGGWVQHDEALVSLPQALVQLQTGRDFFDAAGLPFPTYGYHIDPFGHSIATPALFGQLCGFKGMIINRVGGAFESLLDRSRSREFWWKPSLVGARALAERESLFTHVLFGHYDPPFKFNFTITDGMNLEAAAAELVRHIRTKRVPVFRTRHILVLWGNDYQYYRGTDHARARKLMAMAQNLSISDAWHWQSSTVTRYLDCVRDVLQSKRAELTFSHDFQPYIETPHDVWTGYYATKPSLKQQVRNLERRLRVASMIVGVPAVDLREATQALALMAHHDAITGTNSREAEQEYNMVMAIAEQVLRLKTCIVMRVLRNQPIHTVTVFNSLSRDQVGYKMSLSRSELQPSGVNVSRIVSLKMSYPASVDDLRCQLTMDQMFMRFANISAFGSASVQIRSSDQPDRKVDEQDLSVPCMHSQSSFLPKDGSRADLGSGLTIEAGLDNADWFRICTTEDECLGVSLWYLQTGRSSECAPGARSCGDMLGLAWSSGPYLMCAFWDPWFWVAGVVAYGIGTLLGYSVNLWSRRALRGFAWTWSHVSRRWLLIGSWAAIVMGGGVCGFFIRLIIRKWEADVSADLFLLVGGILGFNAGWIVTIATGSLRRSGVFLVIVYATYLIRFAFDPFAVLTLLPVDITKATLDVGEIVSVVSFVSADLGDGKITVTTGDNCGTGRQRQCKIMDLTAVVTHAPLRSCEIFVVLAPRGKMPSINDLAGDNMLHMVQREGYKAARIEPIARSFFPIVSRLDALPAFHVFTRRSMGASLIRGAVVLHIGRSLARDDEKGLRETQNQTVDDLAQADMRLILGNEIDELSVAWQNQRFESELAVAAKCHECNGVDQVFRGKLPTFLHVVTADKLGESEWRIRVQNVDDVSHSINPSTLLKERWRWATADNALERPFSLTTGSFKLPPRAVKTFYARALDKHVSFAA